MEHEYAILFIGLGLGVVGWMVVLLINTTATLHGIKIWIENHTLRHTQEQVWTEEREKRNQHEHGNLKSRIADTMQIHARFEHGKKYEEPK